MTINIAKPVRHSTDPDLFGGPNGPTDDLLLTDGGKFLLSDGNDDILQQATGDDILLSAHNCTNNLRWSCPKKQARNREHIVPLERKVGKYSKDGTTLTQDQKRAIKDIYWYLFYKAQTN